MTTATDCRWVFPWPIPPPRSALNRGRRLRQSISINDMYVWLPQKGGGRRLSAFAEGAKNGWIKVVVERGQKLPPGWLAIDIALYPPDRIHRDTDGPIKLVQDAVFEGYFVLCLATGYAPKVAKRLAYDYRVVDLHAHRHDPDRANPRIEVAIAPWSPR